MPQNLNMYQYNEDYIFEFRPNAEFYYGSDEFGNKIKLNSYGFHDYSHDYEKDDETFKILIIGDSFVSGLEVPTNKTFPKSLENKLNEAYAKNKKIEVVNAGVNGYSTEQELLFLAKKGLKYNPDFVILAYYIGNDQVDNWERQIFNYADGKLSINENRKFTQGKARAVYYWFSSNFHAFNLAFNSYNKIKSLFHLNEREFVENLGLFVRSSLLKEETKESSELWEKTSDLIDLFNKVLDKKEIPMIIVIIPDKFQEREEYWQEYVKGKNLDEDSLDRYKPQKKVIDIAEKNNIKYLDLLPFFREEMKNKDVHYQADFHWNAAGHKIAADAVFNYIVKNNVVK